MNATYKGDIKIVTDSDYDNVINIQNGQPEMTEFIDTLVLMYVYGVDSWYNGIVNTEPEKMKSEIPEYLKTANVSDETISDMIVLFGKALQPLIFTKIAKSVNASGEIVSVYAIKWNVLIERFNGYNAKYSFIWDKGFFKLFGGSE